MITLYGINNCDTVKKAQKWLNNESIPFEFYDFKKQPLTSEILTRLVNLSDWGLLLNKRSTTYRNLSDALKSNLTDEQAFEQVLLQPTLLKRPLLLIKTEKGEQLHLGFKPDSYQAILQNTKFTEKK